MHFGRLEKMKNEKTNLIKTLLRKDKNSNVKVAIEIMTTN